MEKTQTEVSWSFSLTEEDGDKRKTTRVRKVENGYIVSISKWCKNNGIDEYEDKEYISKDNPIPFITGEKNEEDENISALKGFLSSGVDGMLNVE